MLKKFFEFTHSYTNNEIPHRLFHILYIRLHSFSLKNDEKEDTHIFTY